jgi:hypothetical protein
MVSTRRKVSVRKYSPMPRGELSQVGRSTDQGPQPVERGRALPMQRSQADPGGALDIVGAIVREEGRRRGQSEPVQAELVDACCHGLLPSGEANGF